MSKQKAKQLLEAVFMEVYTANDIKTVLWNTLKTKADSVETLSVDDDKIVFRFVPSKEFTLQDAEFILGELYDTEMFDVTYEKDGKGAFLITFHQYGVEDQYKEDIKEVGDASIQPYTWELELSNEYEIVYTFRTDNNTPYEVHFFDEKKGWYTLMFAAHGKSDIETNKGELYRVMSTLVDITQDFIKKYNPEAINFTGEDKKSATSILKIKPSQRTSLYRAYLQKHLPSNYKIKQVANHTWIKRISTNEAMTSNGNSGNTYVANQVNGRFDTYFLELENLARENNIDISGFNPDTLLAAYYHEKDKGGDSIECLKVASENLKRMPDYYLTLNTQGLGEGTDPSFEMGRTVFGTPDDTKYNQSTVKGGESHRQDHKFVSEMKTRTSQLVESILKEAEPEVPTADDKAKGGSEPAASADTPPTDEQPTSVAPAAEEPGAPAKSTEELALIEELAAIEHNQWKEWATDLMKTEPDLSPKRLERWRTYMGDYKSLPNDIKEMDRKYARESLEVFKKYLKKRIEKKVNLNNFV